MYCIMHEENDFTFTEFHGTYHMLDGGFSICYGPFAVCPPPELPLGWEQSVEPPTPDEMELIDQNAMELAFDLELAW